MIGQKMKKYQIVVVLAAMFLLLTVSVYGDNRKYDSYTQYDDSTATVSYDSAKKKNYVNNAVKIAFAEPFSVYGAEEVEGYSGAKFYKDPANDNGGYLVFPGSYTIDVLVDINDSLLNEYPFLTYAGIIIKN